MQFTINNSKSPRRMEISDADREDRSDETLTTSPSTDGVKSNTSSPIHIMKFGGSCLTDPLSYQSILHILQTHHMEHRIIVLSALQGDTNRLIEIGQLAAQKKHEELFTKIRELEHLHQTYIDQLFPQEIHFRKDMNSYLKDQMIEIYTIVEEIAEFGLNACFRDQMMAFGEKFSTFLMYMFLKCHQIRCHHYNGEELIITDSNFSDAVPDLPCTQRRVEQRILPKFLDSVPSSVLCVTGFIGRNKLGNITTLGRGGSDFTTTILARAIVEINPRLHVKITFWKDVPGILSGNPLIIENPKLIECLSYEEAKEMAFFGAKVLHPKCISIIEPPKIPIHIRKFEILVRDSETEPSGELNNETRNSAPFSIISQENHSGPITGISTIPEASLISVTSATFVNMPGVLGKIFSLLGEHQISVNLVTQSSSEINTTFIVERAQGDQAVEILQGDPFFQNWFRIQQDIVAIIAIIGKRISDSHTRARIYHALAAQKINPLVAAQSVDALNISLAIRPDQLQLAANCINGEFLH